MTLNKALLLEMLQRLLRIRYFEEAVVKLIASGEIPGAAHLCIGHEATLVGACLAGGDNCTMSGNHRSHGHPIAKGANINALMAELLGRTTGVCKGKGGSLHLADFKLGSLGESGIVGSSLPVAAGAGLSSKLRKANDEVTLAFFGDATTAIGAFHESINLAAAWQLPVVYICENNLYGVSTRTGDVANIADESQRAAGYNVPAVIVDGQDPIAVYEAVHEACARARAGGGPTFVEAKTYRFREHAELLYIAEAYRPEAEVREWMDQRDPVENFPQALISQGVIDQQQLQQHIEQARKAIAAAVEFARSSPRPEAADAFVDLYSDSAQPGKAISTFTVDRAEPDEPRVINYLTAINEAQHEELLRDDSVIVLGEDVRANLWGGTRFAKEFSSDRVFDTPISEEGFVGAAIGAAMTGMRPVVDMTIANFVYVAMDQFVSQAAKSRYMFGGQATIPVTYRATMMYGASTGAHHSDRPYPMFMNVPGLKIIAPASAFDAKGLLKAAIRDNNPVICFEDINLWMSSEHVPAEDYVVPLGVADIKRRGSDITLVGIAGGVRSALEAAEQLDQQGVSAEVVDPRTLVPLDIETILDSVRKTGRLVVVDPAHKTCGAAAEICTLVMENAFASLKSPPTRVTAPDTQIPFAPEMEKPLYPNAERIIEAVVAQLEHKALPV